MDLFKTIIFESIFGYIMQGFVVVLGIFAFNRQKIIFKSYIMVSVIQIVITYLLRLLGINYGVHTILILLLLFILSILILKMPIYKTIRSTLLVTILLLVSEMANVAMMLAIYGEETFKGMMNVPLQKAIAGLPGAFIFALLILLSYFILTKDKKKTSDDNGKISE